MNEIYQYLNESPTIFFIFKKKDKWSLEYVTQNVVNLFGNTAEDILLGKINYLDSIHKEDFEEFQEQTKLVLKEQKEEFRFKPYRVIFKDTTFWISQVSKLIKNEEGEIDKIYGYLTDITKQMEVKKDLQNYIDIVNNNILISISDASGNITDCSTAFCKTTGYSKEELIGQKHNILRHKNSSKLMFQNLWDTISKGKVWQGEHKNLGKDGKEFWVENTITPSMDKESNLIKYTSIYNDITNKKEISELLVTDHLTKIHNRRYFNEVFDLEIKRSRRHKYNFILMIIDIDYFKQFNDTYGHHEGDKALIKVANTLKNTLHRPEDYTFRIGGEEFGVITSDITLEGSQIIADKLVKKIEDLKIAHKSSEASKYVTISIGLKLVTPREKLSYNKIYQLADRALYNAKDRGRNMAVCNTK